MSTSSTGIASQVVARIDKELRAIWDESQTDPNVPLKARACTMNLVVVGAGRELIERYTPVVDEVTRTVPSRAILVALCPDAATDEVTGDSNAVCSIEGGTEMCSERARLFASGPACEHIASAIDALLIPEIPTALVWLGRVHTDDPVFLPLAEAATRIIIDSEYTSLTSLLHLAKWAATEKRDVGIADLAWTRIAPWQELVARFFDDAALTPLADEIRTVEIGQASERRAGVGSEAMLLLGWMATRLGWKTTRVGGALGFVRADGKAVRVKWSSVPRPESVAPLSLASITVEAERGGAKLTGTIVRELGSGIKEEARDADMIEWTLDRSDAPRIVHRVRLGANKGAKWLERTLRRPARDPALLESIHFAEHVLEDELEVP